MQPLKGIVIGAAMTIGILGANTIAEPAQFLNGETIIYNITKFGIKVGEAELVYNGLVQMDGQPVIWVTSTSKGFQFYDEEQIYLDPATCHPIKIERDLDIFGNQEKITEYYDRAIGHVRIVKTVDGNTTEQVIEGNSRFDNIYGFIYRTRRIGDLKKNEGIALHLPTQHVEFEYVKSSTYKTAGEKFEAHYMRSRPGNYRIWFDAGPRMLPLRIIGAIGIANMSMEMKDYKQHN